MQAPICTKGPSFPKARPPPTEQTEPMTLATWGVGSGWVGGG